MLEHQILIVHRQLSAEHTAICESDKVAGPRIRLRLGKHKTPHTRPRQWHEPQTAIDRDGVFADPFQLAGNQPIVDLHQRAGFGLHRRTRHEDCLRDVVQTKIQWTECRLDELKVLFRDTRNLTGQQVAVSQLYAATGVRRLRRHAGAQFKDVARIHRLVRDRQDPAIEIHPATRRTGNGPYASSLHSFLGGMGDYAYRALRVDALVNAIDRDVAEGIRRGVQHLNLCLLTL